ncbi:MAG TPA: glycosyltransferase, partial [Bacteroidales bacterium]
YIKYYHETVIGRFSFSLLFNIWKDIKQADIVHVQAIFSSPVIIALFYAWLLKKPTLLTPRGAFATWGLANKKSMGKKVWIKLFLRPFIKKSVWHATSQSEKNDILRQFPQALVSIIPNGIYLSTTKYSENNSSFFNKYYNNKLNVRPTIVSMGRLHEVKGFDILIKSFDIVKEKYNQATLLIAGHDDGELTKLQLLCKELNICDSVFFTGNLEGKDKIDFLACADLFVLPSHTENFGLVYAEALAAGTPIVASTNTPWEEVEDAGCGRWVPNTVEDTTNAMLDLLSRDREQLRQNALKYVQKYDWKNIAKQFKKLYEETLKS